MGRSYCTVHDVQGRSTMLMVRSLHGSGGHWILQLISFLTIPFFTSGVCGNCGEVAFQCRKCRHINYDRLDAFLCVECGYCTAGGFSYELTAGIALNAIAIMDEDG